MKILHIANTSMAGAPVHLSKILNKYSDIESVSVLKKKFTSSHLNNLLWKYDYINPDITTLNNLVNKSDIIHYHNKPFYSGMYFEHKKDCIQFHSQPTHHKGEYVPNSSYSNFNGRKLVIAQYHTRFYTDAQIIPNMIDIFDEIYNDVSKNDKITIFFSYADESSGWAYKGVKEITNILNTFRDVCNIQIVNNVPYNELIKLKCKADIVIGDCITGSYHLSDLEGLACKALTINNIDELCLNNIKYITGQNINPFINSNLSTLSNTIKYYINNIALLREIQEKSRKWMEEYWNPKNLVKYFIDFYNGL